MIHHNLLIRFFGHKEIVKRRGKWKTLSRIQRLNVSEHVLTARSFIVISYCPDTCEEQDLRIQFKFSSTPVNTFVLG